METLLPMTALQAPDLARAALRRLAELKMPPTPQNFAHYDEEAVVATTGRLVRPVTPRLLDASAVRRFDDLVDRPWIRPRR